LPACYDILGIGFGPANLALAIALEESATDVAVHFMEARKTPAWQDGMLLAGSNIQNHPVRDLVTLRNPRSRYSFINYLFESGRLLAHLNLPLEFPLRKEYAQYIAWVADDFGHVAEFGSRVIDIKLSTLDGKPAYLATTADGTQRAGRVLVLGPGRTPHVPAPFDTALGPKVFHLTEYRHRLAGLPTPRRVAVIGGSQSAVEITLDLSKRFPDAEIVNYVRAFGLRLKDTSPFSEEGFSPEFTKYYYEASRAGKQSLDTYMRLTNYSSADADVLHELYALIYEQRLDGHQRIWVSGNRQVADVDTADGRVRLTVREINTGEIERDEVDFVVVATGFRDLGPAEHQESYPALLAGLSAELTFDEAGYLAVNEDYSLVTKSPGTPPIFLNGLCESSHGIGDSGSFSLLSLRAETILRGYLDRWGRPANTGVMSGGHGSAGWNELRELEDSTL
jgi:L-ornithine N5-oxygenase